MTPARREADPFARIAPYYDLLMAGAPYDMWADYVAQLAELAARPIKPGHKLLDLATGTGPVALEFAARGSVVTGIDCSEPMLAQATRKAAERCLDVRFLCHDLSDFHLAPQFDHALCLYDSLNYILEPDLLERAFANTRQALKPEGMLIFDVNTVHALEAELFTQSSRPGAVLEYRWNSTYDPCTRISRISMSFRIPATGDAFTLIHHQRAYTQQELRSLLYAAGFTNPTTYQAYTMLPPGPGSDRVFYAARASAA